MISYQKAPSTHGSFDCMLYWERHIPVRDVKKVLRVRVMRISAEKEWGVLLLSQLSLLSKTWLSGEACRDLYIGIHAEKTWENQTPQSFNNMGLLIPFIRFVWTIFSLCSGWCFPQASEHWPHCVYAAINMLTTIIISILMMMIIK